MRSGAIECKRRHSGCRRVAAKGRGAPPAAAAQRSPSHCRHRDAGRARSPAGVRGLARSAGRDPVVSVARSGIAAARAAIDSVCGGHRYRTGQRGRDFSGDRLCAARAALVSTLGDAERGVWHLRMWCAKEAAGRAIGAIDAPAGVRNAHDGAIRLRLDAGRRKSFPRCATAASGRREGDLVSSTLVTLR